MSRSIVVSEQGKKVVEELTTIGNWAKSCKTREQLMLVDKFLNKKVATSYFKFPSMDSSICHLHLGVVDGIILTLAKTKFAQEK